MDSNNNDSTAATVKLPLLIGANYPAWAPKFKIFLHIKTWSHHLLYDSFKDYFAIVYAPTSFEIQVIKLLSMVQARDVDNEFTEVMKQKEIFDLMKIADTRIQLEATHQRLWIANESRITSYLKQSTDIRFHQSLDKAKSVKKAWAKLKKECNQQEAGTMMSLMNRFFKDSFQPNDELVAFTSRVQQVAHDMVENLGREPTFAEIICFKVIASLPAQYDAIQQKVFHLETNKFNIEELITIFSIEDSRQQANKMMSDKSKSSTNPDEAFVLANKNTNRFKKSQQTSTERIGSTNKKCLDCNKLLDKNQPIRHSRCTGCHISHKENQPSTQDIQPKDSGNIVQLLSLSNVDYQRQTAKKWYLDSGCTNHVTNSSNSTKDLVVSNRAVCTASGEVTHATNIGTAIFNTDAGQVHFQNTLIIPDITKNLLSVKSITSLSDDHHVIFNQNKCQVFKGEVTFNGQSILQGQIDESGLYAISPHLEPITSTMNEMNSVINNNSTEQILITRSLQDWHECLGHINKKAIMKLVESTQDFQVTNADQEIKCAICDAAKMNRKKFAEVMPERANLAGEVIYSDICGPISPSSIGGSRYIIHFLDEKSGYNFVYLAKKKSDAFNLFKIVRARINNHGPSSLKTFVTDGGGEYIGADFQEFLQRKGIFHAKSPANTPQRQGKSERLGKILINSALTMLLQRRMPLKFWGLAILYAAYIRNRTTKPGQDKTRHELLLGGQPSVKHCLPFGSPVMYHNHDPHIKKLDQRAFQGIFVGFHEENHSYKIWDEESQKLVLTRDIKSYSEEVFKFNNNINDDDNNLQQFLVGDDDWINGGSSIAHDSQEVFFQQLNNNNNNNNIENHVNNNIINNNNILNHNENDHNNFNEESDEDFDIFDNPIQPNHNQININPAINSNHQEVRQSISQRTRSKNTLNHDQNLSVEQIFAIMTLDEIPTPETYQEAIKSSQSEEWKKSIKEEQDSLINLETFQVVPRPFTKKAIQSRYVFKIKTDDQGRIARFKTRLVAKGYTQIKGVDFFDTFSPALRLSSFRFLLSTAVLKKFSIYHLDVQTAFLNGDLAEEIYMEIPEGFDAIKEDRRSHVLKLNKSIYGLKQASRVWNEKFTTTIVSMNFVQSQADPCIFIKYDCNNNNGEPVAIIGLFVDDCFVLGQDEEVEEVKNQLMSKFNMHDLGLLSFALGIKVIQQNNNISISQKAYINKCLEKFNMQDSTPQPTPLPDKPQDRNYHNNFNHKNNIKDNSDNQKANNNQLFDDINLYQQLIGCLIYLANATRPDISYAVGYLARAMTAPTTADWINAKRVLRYLKGSSDLSLCYNNQTALTGYSDSSYAEETDRKSVGGYVFVQAGAAVTWRSTKQEIIAQSSMEAEYIALAESAKEALWIRKLQREIFPTTKLLPTTIYEDNQSAIKLTENPIHSNRSKHIDVRYHAIREYVKNNLIKVEYLSTTEMLADIMTKSLGRILHAKFVLGMGLRK